MSIVCCVFKCMNLGKINKKSGTLSVFSSLKVQRFRVRSATLFSYICYFAVGGQGAKMQVIITS